MKHDFFKAIYSHTTQDTPGKHTLNGVTFRLCEYADAVELSEIKSQEQKKGCGSAFMRLFTELADQHNVRLQLQPAENMKDLNRDGEAPLTKEEKQAKLVEWYKRFGFVPKDNYTLERAPGQL